MSELIDAIDRKKLWHDITYGDIFIERIEQFDAMTLANLHDIVRAQPTVDSVVREVESTVPLIRHPYCEGCKEFNPVLDYEKLYAGDKIVSCYMNVKCEHYDLCRELHDHMSK